MRRTSSRVGPLAVAVVAIASSAVLLAPPAAAEVATVGSFATSVPTTVHVGRTNQLAADWILEDIVSGSDLAVGDTITVALDDDDPASNCTTSGGAVAFTAAPTVTTTNDSPARFTGALSASGACGTDTLTLTATVADADGDADLLLSGIRYDVGLNAAPGRVRVDINDSGSFTSGPANALVSRVEVKVAGPPTLLSPIADNQPVPQVTLDELVPGALPADGDVCVTLRSPTSADFDVANPSPTVAVSGGNGTVEAGSNDATTSEVRFTVDVASTDASRYTISGIRIDTVGSERGAVLARVGNCSEDDERYQVLLQLGLLGSVDRLMGNDRYATAARIAAEEFVGDDKCLNGKTVVIARGDNFPDALAASYLAGTNDVPILLTQPGSVPQPTVQALQAHGVTHVILVGGNAAISQTVAAALASTDVTACTDPDTDFDPTEGQKIAVSRTAGEDRYGTARAAAQQPGADQAGTADLDLDGEDCGGDNTVKTAVVTSGDGFADALAVGGLAYGGFRGIDGCGEGPLPLLLTPRATLHPSTAAGLAALDIVQVIIVGGPAAVSDAVFDAISDVQGVEHVVRVAGADRQATAAEVAAVVGQDDIGAYQGTVLISRPDDFPDALAAAALGGRNGWPLLLTTSTSSLGPTAGGAIVGYPSEASFLRAYLLGGTSALTEAVRDQTAQALASQSVG